VVVVQDDIFDATNSITICAFTTDETEAPLFRIPIHATPLNGLGRDSVLMVDKLTTIPRRKVGQRLGALDDGDVVRLNRAIMVFLGLAGTPSP
jgi:mRNA interferase MazF